MQTPEDKLIQKIKELRQEFEENPNFTPLMLQYFIEKYVAEEYRKNK